MRPTRLRLLLGVAVVVGVATWGVLRVVAAWRGGYPDITWVTPATLWLLAAALLGTALAARPRLRRKPGAKPLPPLVAARLAALALASSRVGAAVAGAYVGFVVALAGDLDTPYGRERAVYAGLSVLGALALVAAALLLERACRLPDEGAGAGPGLGSAA